MRRPGVLDTRRDILSKPPAIIDEGCIFLYTSFKRCWHNFPVVPAACLYGENVEDLLIKVKSQNKKIR